MKTIAALGVFALTCFASRADARNFFITIENCDRLVEAAEYTSDYNVEGELQVDHIECDSWTDIRIRGNKLKLTGGDKVAEGVTFTNARFLVQSGAVLRSDIVTKLTGDDEAQMKNGGVLLIAEGGKARFKEKLTVASVTIFSSNKITSHGGCIYNAGYFRAEGEFRAESCLAWDGNGGDPGNGSGIYNTGKVIFKDLVHMEDCGMNIDSSQKFNVNLGGAIYNEGKVSFFRPSGSAGEAVFRGNKASQGGALHNAKSGTVKFLKKVSATFTENKADDEGGHIFNAGKLVMRSSGFFNQGYSRGGGGAIYNAFEAEMMFVKPAALEFKDNESGHHGGAVYTWHDGVFGLEKAQYINNSIPGPGLDKWCPNVFAKHETDPDGYTCYPED